MVSTNCSLIFLIFLGLLSVYALNAAESNSEPSKLVSSKKKDLGNEKSNINVENVANKIAADDPKNETCNCNNTTPGADAEKSNNGYGAGSIFVGILFGMGLMFALSQLYVFWEKRRLGDTPAYRGY